jgi:hypothetical protein
MIASSLIIIASSSIIISSFLIITTTFSRIIAIIDLRNYVFLNTLYYINFSFTYS